MRTLAVAVLATLACGCSEPRPVVPDVRRECLTWTHDVEPITSAKCDSCHGATDPGGGYRTDSYLAAIGAARAGDATSPLVTTLDPAKSDTTHRPFATDFATFKTWVVDCSLGFTPSQVHDPGILNPASEQFHGKLVENNDFDLGLCQQCHGTDFAGGKAGQSTTCLTCHKGGPTACTTCHGQPPATGAHLAHVQMDKLDCAECHKKPAVWNEAGHLHAPPGKVTFASGRAGSGAAYDAGGKTCSGVSCHGGTLGDTTASNTKPKWTGGPDQAACGTCHGLPPSTPAHQQSGNKCSFCHSLVVDDQMHIKDASLHADGKVELGPGTGCASCHGQPPPTGAHLAHVNALHELRGPIDCAECHKKPATVDEAGHIDNNVQVFPSGISGIATADFAMPKWDATAGTCSSVYCHGGGDMLEKDTWPNVDRTPSWTAGDQGIVCGTCHGIPPKDGIHPQGVGISDCATCHPATMDRTGAILVNNGQSSHMNGVIDVQLPQP